MEFGIQRLQIGSIFAVHFRRLISVRQQQTSRTIVLAWNQRKVRQLTPGEIWLFIVGRGLAVFGLGALTTRYVPALAGTPGVVIVALGVAVLHMAGKGFARRAPDEQPPRPAV